MPRKYTDPTEAAFQDLYRTTARSARRRGIDFKLSRKEFRDLIGRDCVYCGQKPSQRYSHGRRARGTITYSGLDRVRSDGAYEAANVVPACRFCNFSKGTRSPEYFALHLVQIVQHAVNRLIGVENPRYELLPAEAVAVTAPSPCDAKLVSKPARSRKLKGN